MITMPYMPLLLSSSFALMLRCWSANPSARPTFSEVAASLDTILKPVADYVEIRMNLVPAESEVDEGGYEIIGSGDVSPGGRVEPEGVEPVDVYESVGAEEDDGITVYENSDQTENIPVHPNPVYGESGENGCGGGVGGREEMDDIPVHPNPVYGERGGTDDGGGVGGREEMDDIPVHPNPVYGGRGNGAVIDSPAV